MQNVKTYITYFDDNQIKEYNLKADENTILFKGDDTSYSGESINNLNTFYCELCTMYYVWKNNLKSDYVCFKQYRRPFNWELATKLPETGEIITFNPVVMRMNIITQYIICHGSKRGNEVVGNLIREYGAESNVVKYFTESHQLYTNNSMVLKWEDFVKMCEFVFGFLDKLDKFYKLNYNYSKYEKNAIERTEDGRFDYQMHWMAYIGERMVSAYISLYLKPITIERLEGNGFYKPYQSKKK